MCLVADKTTQDQCGVNTCTHSCLRGFITDRVCNNANNYIVFVVCICFGKGCSNQQ